MDYHRTWSKSYVFKVLAWKWCIVISLGLSLERGWKHLPKCYEKTSQQWLSEKKQISSYFQIAVWIMLLVYHFFHGLFSSGKWACMQICFSGVCSGVEIRTSRHTSGPFQECLDAENCQKQACMPKHTCPNVLIYCMRACGENMARYLIQNA